MAELAPGDWPFSDVVFFVNAARRRRISGYTARIAPVGLIVPM
jgi:hypothetical protein